jgi:hypothetical protein
VTQLRTILAGLVVWFIACAGTAAAQPVGDVPVRAMTASFRELPSVSFSVRDLVDSEVVKKLQSGLPQTITTRIYTYSERSREPLTIAALSCRVVYDLWEGIYRIERQTESSDKTLTSRSLDGVVTQCLTFQSYPVGDAKLLERMRGSQVYFAVVSELNPLSPDAVQRIRRWLARPSGSELNGNAFFGSFVSIFVGRKLGEAEKILSFRSSPHAVPP